MADAHCARACVLARRQGRRSSSFHTFAAPPVNNDSVPLAGWRGLLPHLLSAWACELVLRPLLPPLANPPSRRGAALAISNRLTRECYLPAGRNCPPVVSIRTMDHGHSLSNCNYKKI